MILTAFIAKTLLAASLTVPAALDRSVQWPLPERGTAMSVDQKDAAIGPLVKSATECIVRTVTADPRFPVMKGGVEFNNLIVDSVPTCADDLRRSARLFDDIWYGGRPAGPDADAALRALDERVRAAQPHVVGARR